MPLALRSFRSALASGPQDRAAAHTDLGEVLLTTGDRAEAKRQTLEALEIAPSFERAQDLLLKLSEKYGRGRVAFGHRRAYDRPAIQVAPRPREGTIPPVVVRTSPSLLPTADTGHKKED